MKPEEVVIGIHEVGPFTISVQKPAHQDTQDYFEVLLTEKVGGLVMYKNLADTWGLFRHLQEFSRKITEEDVAEYNAHVSSVFHKIGQPLFRLSRNMILRLFDECQALTKKMNKRR
jgi:hypothetical protein